MSGAPAARETDKLKHESAMLGFFAGAVAALAVGVFVIGTGGVGLAVLVAAGGIAGAGVATLIDSVLEDPGITTGAVGPGTNDIEINGLSAVAVIDPSLCYFPVVYNHGNKVIVEGSETVFYGCRPAARKGDTLLCEAKITTGSPNVIIGGAKVRIVGTRRSKWDMILDYGSIYLTVLFAGSNLVGLAITGSFIAISETISYQMHRANASTAAVATMQGGMNIGNAVTGQAVQEAMVRSGNARAEMLATQTFEAGRQAEANAMYQRYVQGKIARGQPYQPQAQWARNNRVRWALNQRTPPRVAPTPTARPSRWKAAGKLGLQLGVDIIRNYREIQRENAVPQVVSCEDTSWLEPS